MFTEHLDAFFSTSEFASTVTLNSVTVQAIFDAPYATGSVGGFGMASTQPTLTLPTASAPTDPVGKTAVVNSVNYVVVAHEPDGTGVSRLLLEAA
ncbi:MAG: head-tail joining protein [Rhodoferax sp.]